MDGANRTFAVLGRSGISLILDNTFFTASYCRSKPELSLWGFLAQFNMSHSSLLMIFTNLLFQNTNIQYLNRKILSVAYNNTINVKFLLLSLANMLHMCLLTRLQSLAGSPSVLLLSILLDLVTDYMRGQSSLAGRASISCSSELRGQSVTFTQTSVSLLTSSECCCFLTCGCIYSDFGV